VRAIRLASWRTDIRYAVLAHDRNRNRNRMPAYRISNKLAVPSTLPRLFSFHGIRGMISSVHKMATSGKRQLPSSIRGISRIVSRTNRIATFHSYPMQLLLVHLTKKTFASI
jgi:hypothetical protein